LHGQKVASRESVGLAYALAFLVIASPLLGKMGAELREMNPL
jgi:hypothetical protein